MDVDLSEYNQLNNEFNRYFAYFGWDFAAAMKCATNAVYRNKFAKVGGLNPGEVAGMAFG